jgi:hypothetical protein
MDLLVRNGDTRQQRLAGETLVRVRMVGRDEALVAPPDVPRAPLELDPGEALVGGRGGRASGECDPERTRRPSPLGDPAGRERG